MSDRLPTGGDPCTWSGIFVADKLESWRKFWDPGGQGEREDGRGERGEARGEREEGGGGDGTVERGGGKEK